MKSKKKFPLWFVYFLLFVMMQATQNQEKEENNKHAVYGIQMPHDFKHMIPKDWNSLGMFLCSRLFQWLF